MRVTALAPAKINLTLDVVGRRDDGYHLLRSVMQTVSLYDEVTLSLTKDTDITLHCDGNIPCDASNTAYKAAEKFRERVGYKGGFCIDVQKHIPSQAGLAGGSSDAAAVLTACNRLTGFPLSIEELCELGAEIGADVPFCVQGGTVLCTGTGTQLTPVTPLPPCTIVLVKPEGGVSTPEAYRLLDDEPQLFHPNTQGLCAALKEGDLTALGRCVGNSFEKPLQLPFTADIVSRLKQGGALAAALSGSGSTVFGIFADEQVATKCASNVKTIYPKTWVCEPCDGIVIK